MRRLFLAAISFMCACGDKADVVEEGDIDGNKRLVDVNTAEGRALCVWIRSMTERLPKLGSRQSCNGRDVPFVFSVDCQFASNFPKTCPATVQDARDCYPAFIDFVAREPCVASTVSTTKDLEALIARVPACKWFNGCAYQIPKP